MEAVGAGFNRGVHDCAAGASKFSTKVVGLNIEFLNGVDRRLDHVSLTTQKIDIVAVVVDAIEKVVVLRRAGTVGGKLVARPGAWLRLCDTRSKGSQHGPA